MLNKNDIYTIGDNDNDYPMLKEFKGYYIGNPNQNIKDEEPKNNEEDNDETMSIELPKLKEEPILKDENPDKFNFI